MRTTLTLDDDVANRLAQLQHKTGEAFKLVVNKALRAGLQAMERSPQGGRKRYVTKTSGGAVKHDLVSVSDALAFAEGEDFK